MCVNGFDIHGELCCVLVAAEEICVWLQPWSLDLGATVHYFKAAKVCLAEVHMCRDQQVRMFQLGGGTVADGEN